MSLKRGAGAGEVSGASNFYNFPVTNSLLFNGGGGLRISSGEANTSYWTLSVWIKRHKLGGNYCTIMSATNYGGTYSTDVIGFGSANTMLSLRGSNANSFTSNTGTRVVRDCGNWYHYHLRNNNGTVTRTLNGVVDGTYSISGTFTGIGRSGNHDIGAYGGSSESYNNNFSLAEFYFINDSGFNNDNNYDYDQFAEFKNGVLIPKENSLNAAAIGDGGWYYEFKQAGDNADANGVGADSSGNAHHASIIGTVSAHCRARPDTPTNNFCTLNANRTGQVSNLTNGALSYKDSNTGGPRASVGTMGAPSGKIYFEIRLNNDLYSTMCGFMDPSAYEGSHLASDTNRGTGHFGWDDRGYFYTDSGSGSIIASFTTNDVLGFAIDIDAGKAFIRKNADAFVASADPSDGSNPNHTFTAGQPMTPFIASYRSAPYTLNCGQDSTFGGEETVTTLTDSNGQGLFHTEPPTGYLALCSANFPEPTLSANAAGKPEDHFIPFLYTSGNIGQNGTQNVTGVGFKPDFVWIKNRDSTSTAHTMYDSNRGTGRHLSSDSDAAEVGLNSEYGYLGTFGQANGDADGFVLRGGSTNSNYVAQSTNKYVSWNWKANGGTATASASETDNANPAYSQQANPTAGFSIITYTGTGADATIPHGLSVAPELILTKSRSDADHWYTYSKQADAANPEQYEVYLNLSLAAYKDSSDNTRAWNATLPSNSVFSIGTSDGTNEDGDNYVAYCFHSVAGFSKFGLYTGNNDSDGPCVFTGFRPSFIMTKPMSAAGNWYINDTARSPGNPTSTFGDNLYADSDGPESGNGMDIFSTGFKIRNTDGSQNGSSVKIMYMAFASHPFKYCNAR